MAWPRALSGPSPALGRRPVLATKSDGFCHSRENWLSFHAGLASQCADGASGSVWGSEHQF